MKKTSFGRRRSSATARNTFGSSTYGRQNSFDGNDLRLNNRESRGMDKTKSGLLKPGFSAKKSMSSDNLFANDPKQWSSTVKKPSSSSRHAMVRSTTALNMTGINLVASTPCVTPGFNPNLPGINSSYKKNRLSSESRYSSYGVVKNRKEMRPLNEKEFQLAAINKIQNYFMTAPNACHILNNGSMKPMTTTMFNDMCEYLLYNLDRNQLVNKAKYMEELPKIMKKYYYKGKVDRSWLITVNASHSFPQVVGLLLWLVELCEAQNSFNVMDTLYPSILDPDEIENDDYEQMIEFKTYLPYLLNSYQIESRATGKPVDKEILQKQEELLLENYKNILGVDEEMLIKLEAEVNSYKDELDSLCDKTEEQKLEETKTIKVALQKDIVSIKNYTKEIQICIGDVQDYITKKKEELVFRETEIENLKGELSAVESCIDGQQITKEDIKIIEEEMMNLKQDIKYEESCLNEYSNIVYSEDLNIVNVRSKLDQLFVQYNKICAENIVVLPELENAIADKNVLAMHVRESLKHIDELLKSLKNQFVEKLKVAEQKAASVQLERESITLEYNNLMKVAEKLALERGVEKKRLEEVTDHQFEARKDYENKIYELQAELKNIDMDNTNVETKIKEKNILSEMVNNMEQEKDYIMSKTTACLEEQVKMFNETNQIIVDLFAQQKQDLKAIDNKYSVV